MNQGEIDHKNEDFSFFQLPLIPEMFDEDALALQIRTLFLLTCFVWISS